MSDNIRKIITDAITRMLARREHAQSEIIRKLTEKGFELSDFLSILEEFVEAGIQSDSRYADMRLRACVSKGQGFLRIKRDLMLTKVSESDIEQAFRDNDVDWFELALQVKVKRFGDAVARDLNLKQKQIRFLQYRGFDHEQIQYALNPH